MKKKRGYKFMLIIYCFLMIIGTAVGYSAYTINNKDIVGLSSVTKPDANKNLNKVIFKDGDNGPVVDTVYVPSGEAIDSSNTPTIGSNRIKWHENNASGAVKLDLCDKNLKSFTPSNKNTTLVAERVTVKDNVSNVITDNNKSNGNPNGSNTTVNGNNITMVEKTGADKSDVCNDITIGGSLDSINVDSKYIGKDGTNEIENNVMNGGNYQFNNDVTIGLEDPAVQPSRYKPFAGGTGVNYCVSRITLDADLILTNSTLNIGAMTGFYGTAPNWSQRNMQGFIMGNYSEIDLNGHNLIVGAGSFLNAYGSITDSSKDRTGRLIVENGGTLLSTFVVEDQNYEKGLPVLYYNGGEIFDSYRCPYLDCSIRIKSGARFNAVLRLDFGGDNPNCLSKILNVISPDNSSLLTMNGGYIDRSVSYDEEVYKINNTFMKQNIMHQIIKYEIHDCTELKINHTVIKMKMSSYNFNFHFFKNGFLIPPYFRLYFYNSKFTLPINLTFLPGSYLYVDEKSVINLISTVLNETYKAEFPAVGFDYNYLYQCVGGLNFASEIYDHKEAVANKAYDDYEIGWVDNYHDVKGGGDNGDTTQIHFQSLQFASYCNQKRRAHCDMLGTFQIGNIDNYNNLSVMHKLGGEINIKNVESFKNTIASRNDVLLYASNPKFGACISFGKLLNAFAKQAINIMDYFISPLVSNGNVLMDVNNQGKVRNDYKTNIATYDKATGLVSYNNKKYAFIHTDVNYTNWDGDISHSNKTLVGLDKGRNLFESEINCRIRNYKGNKDSNYGKFFEVTENADHSIHAPVNASGKNNYIFFRGAFMPYDGTNVYIDKLRAGESNLKQLGTVRSAKYITNDGYYDHPVWRLRK